MLLRPERTTGGRQVKAEGVCSFDDVVCKRATDKALLVVIEGDEFWIPQSQIHEDSEVFDDGEHSTGVLVVTEWIAQQKGLA